jgi:transposase
VAGLVDEIGLVDILNKRLGIDPREKVSTGVIVKAMILNGLGFVSAPLYLFGQFFQGKATEQLLGEGIKPEHLNDDRLGNVLDEVYAAGLSELFLEISLAAANKFEVKRETAHLDSTSFHVDGAYASSEPGVIEITYGYSRDHRPDLKQFMMNLICVGDGDIPVLMEMASGNQQQITWHQLAEIEIVEKKHYDKPGKPKPDAVPSRISFRVTATVVAIDSELTAQRVRCGRFILASNVLDAAVLSASDALREYKAQQGVERGFRFLKDPLFFASSVFLKSPKRIAALGMIMALCLLVYNLGQRQLRQALACQDETIPNQLGKPTSSPTLRWVFQCFMAVHLVVFQGVQQVVNLTDERLHILQFFSDSCRRYYLLSVPPS